MSKASDAGKAFMAGVLAKLPEAERAQAEKIFLAAEAEGALEVIGTGALAQPEINRKLDEIAAQDRDLKAQVAAAQDLYTRNDTWYKSNKAALDEYPTMKSELERLKANGGGGDDDEKDDKQRRHQDPPDIRKMVDEILASTLETSLAERERGYVDVVAFMQDKGIVHYQTFGTPVNMRELVANPKLGKPIVGQPGRVFSLEDAYAEKYGEQVAAKQKEIHDKAIETEVQKRLTEERAKGVGLPFPLRGDPSPSVLDVLQTKEGPGAHNLDTAVAAYEQLQAGRGLSGG